MTPSARARYFLGVVLIGWFLCTVLGCEVTEEKIGIWKGTKNGPKKLAGAVIDREINMAIRAKAAVALVDIGRWELYRSAFQKVEKADAEQVVAAVVPILAKTVEGDGKGNSLTQPQIDAKDALYILLDYIGDTAKPQAEQVLIKWCLEDYNVRAMAGQYSIKTIVRKIGPAAADALVPLLSVKEMVIKYVAELIREVGDDKVIGRASTYLAKELTDNIENLREVHLESAAIIGGAPVFDALIDLATNNSISDKIQRFALRAFSIGMEKGSIEMNGAQAERLIAMAESSEFDQYQREETFYVIAQKGRKEVLPHVRKLLADKSGFWRAVGYRCILRIDGEGQILSALQEMERLKLNKISEDVNEVIHRTASFPALLPKIRELLHDTSPFVRAIAVNVLARNGISADKDLLSKLVSDNTRLPKGFTHKTLGEAAQAAIEVINKRG